MEKTSNPLMEVISPSNFEKSIIRVMEMLEGGNLLDIGGGRGKTFDYGLMEYHALDINSHNDKNFIQGDITKENLDIGKKFSLIITKDTFEHILNPWDATANIVNLLEDGGVFVCSVPFSWRFHPSPYDTYRYTHQGLNYLFRHKGEIAEIASGYMYNEKIIRGFWKNKFDNWPFSRRGFRDNVSSFFVGIKITGEVFDISTLSGDFSIGHS